MDGIINFINGEFFDLRNMTPEEMAAHDAEIERRKRQQAAQEKIEINQKSGVPERYNEKQATAAKAAINFLHACGEFKSLVMIGSAGTGKTHLACAIIREGGEKYRITSERRKEAALKRYGEQKIEKPAEAKSDGTTDADTEAYENMF